ncbi:SAM-dependent methyltransferase [Roseibium denhamense]|uniref:tRNA1(Val) A37 N6-methylase TrmN6 n=1 Tax=Roseibium denhamense TaxID=76305 RepID=A0ABY1N5J7_9HYPH|nr:methyltransferase [Roseibium denhamense]MTI04379.1 SAM-dependent methyltransferase [Roseibium denhamense]SMP00743.1 tRNA1(Val) A37 N6-methylase TrmN6 [Roseibium denhamense]
MDDAVTIADEDVSHDAFLGGKVYIHQPKRGRHRAGLDAVYLAAALPDSVSGHVVDLGAGVGTAGFCAASRLPQIKVSLVELDEAALNLAERGLKDPANAAFSCRVSVLQADITAKGSERHLSGLTSSFADHAIMNPPYYPAGHFRASPNSARAGAHMLDERGLEPWVKTATDIVRQGGTLTMIFRAEGLQELLGVLKGRFGAIDVLPLRPRSNAPATRILVRAVRSSKAPLQLLSGFVIHTDDGSDFTPEAKSVLREGAGLGLPMRRGAD